MNRLGDIGRCAPLTKVFTHLMWFMCISQDTSQNDLQHYQRYAWITRGLCASAGWHRHWPTLGTIREGFWPLGKSHRPMINNINQGLNTYDITCAIWKEMLDNGMQHQQGYAHIIRVMCASVGRHLYRPTSKSINQGLRSSSKRCWNTKKHQPRHTRISHDVCT